MNRILLISFILFGFIFAQTNTRSIIKADYIQITLDSTMLDTVYYLFKSEGGGANTYLSEVAPSGIEHQAVHWEYLTAGAIRVEMVTDTSTAEESDSLYASMQPFDWNYFKGTYVASSNELTYLDFDTYDSYDSVAVDYLDWTHGYSYGADLGGFFGPSTGFRFIFGQLANDNAGAATILDITIFLLQ